jgi:hypothetical protein
MDMTNTQSHTRPPGKKTFWPILGSFLVLQQDFTPVSEVVTDVVFDARDTPHNYALGGIARPPKPSQGRIPVWAKPPLTADGPAARASRLRFF